MTAELTNAPKVPATKIWDYAAHNAFLDLAWYHGRWFCAFREGSTHLSGDGRTRVLVSDDGLLWKSSALLEVGPRFKGFENQCDVSLSETPDGRLFLKVVTWDPRWPKPQSVMARNAAWFTRDGAVWDGPREIGDPNFSLWKIKWRQGVAYSVAHDCAAELNARVPVRLYTSNDGLHWRVLLDPLCNYGPAILTNESTLEFLGDGAAVCLTRCHYVGQELPGRNAWECPAVLGTARAPYTVWQWRKTDWAVGGPKLLALADGTLLLASRRWLSADWSDQRLDLCRVNLQSARFEPVVTFVSGGDSCYAGMVEHAGKLAIAYYSSHEGKAGIYFTQLALPLLSAQPANR
ncbi:MAG: hypothetical protein HYV35_06560 [Lentisphaerae bacterium]|nr:hypothetical protein [Lentisphaerota bacterium]